MTTQNGGNMQEESEISRQTSSSSSADSSRRRPRPTFGRLGCGRFGLGFVCGAVSVMTFNSVSSQFGMRGPEWGAVGWSPGGTVYDTVSKLTTVGGGGEQQQQPPSATGGGSALRKNEQALTTRGGKGATFDLLHGNQPQPATATTENAEEGKTTTSSTTTFDQIISSSDHVFKDHIVMSRSAWIFGMWGRGGHLFCPDAEVAIANATRSPLADGRRRPILMNVTFESEGLFRNANTGQGNWITAMYAMRLQAFQRDLDMMLWCDDAEANKANHILPWLNGYFPARDRTSAPFPFPHPPPPKRPSKLLDSCDKYELAEMTPFVKHDLRRMAIALVGIPYKGHPSEAWAEEWLWSGRHPNPDIMQLPDPKRDDPPIVPNVEVDDAAIHFRCEDLMATNHPSFGFMKFTAYSRRIYPTARSIGIVTNPFHKDAQNRGGAGRRPGAIEACKTVTFALRDFLSEKFPSAKVSIRNEREETVATAFARLIMANQTIAGISSFGIWTAMANFGHGFIRKPDYRKAPNEWSPPLSDMYDDISMFTETKRLPAFLAGRMKGDMDKLLNWFRNDDVDLS